MEIMQSNKAKQSVCLSHPSLEVCQGDVEDGELSLHLSRFVSWFVSLFIEKMELSRLDPATLGFKTCQY